MRSSFARLAIVSRSRAPFGVDAAHIDVIAKNPDYASMNHSMRFAETGQAFEVLWLKGFDGEQRNQPDHRTHFHGDVLVPPRCSTS